MEGLIIRDLIIAALLILWTVQKYQLWVLRAAINKKSEKKE